MISAIGDSYDIRCVVVRVTSEQPLKFPPVSGGDFRGAVIVPVSRQGICGGLEGQLLPILLNRDSHRFGAALLDRVCNGFHSVNRVAGVLHQRVIFRQQSVIFQELQKKFLRIIFDVLLCLCLDEQFGIGNIGDKRGFRQFAQLVITMELPVRRLIGENLPDSAFFYAMVPIVFQIP